MGITRIFENKPMTKRKDTPLLMKRSLVALLLLPNLSGAFLPPVGNHHSVHHRVAFLLAKEETDESNNIIDGERINETVTPVRPPGQPSKNSNNDNPLASFFKFIPKPPDSPPPEFRYEDLLKESDKVNAGLEDLESELIRLRRELATKEAALQQGKLQATQERDAIREKLEEYSNQIQDKDDILAEQSEQQEKLEREVSILQGQLPAVQNQLKSERKRSDELRERLLSVEDTLEFQQMEFEKEKDELQKAVDREKKRLSEIQSQWDVEKNKFMDDRLKVEQQLKQQELLVEAAEKVLKSTQEVYNKERESLRMRLEDQRASLEESQRALDREREATKEVTTEMAKEIGETKARLEQVETYLKEAEKLFQKSESDLQDKLLDEQIKVKKLTDRLAKELKQFEDEKAELEGQIAGEQAKIRAVEVQLREERLDFETEKVRLEFELKDEQRIRQLKTEQMKKRYDNIRAELTALWQGALRESRDQRNTLKKKYDRQLDEVRNSNTQLQSDLKAAKENSVQLQSLLRDVTKQKGELEKENTASEARYKLIVAQQGAEINSLKGKVTSLENELRKKEEELLLYKSSYRQQLGASMQLTGNRVLETGTKVAKQTGSGFVNTRTRVSRFIRRRFK